MRQCTRKYLLLDHSKFGQRALCKVLDIGQINEVITDAGTAATDLALLEQHGVAVRVAPGQDLPLETAIHAS
jgi:DeoR/GlpR family transcriptional regulator of sugar metabolism